MTGWKLVSVIITFGARGEWECPCELLYTIKNNAIFWPWKIMLKISFFYIADCLLFVHPFMTYLFDLYLLSIKRWNVEWCSFMIKSYCSGIVSKGSLLYDHALQLAILAELKRNILIMAYIFFRCDYKKFPSLFIWLYAYTYVLLLFSCSQSCILDFSF